jgi:hypothetical protein
MTRNGGRTGLRPILVLLICFGLILPCTKYLSAAPKVNPKAKAGDCAACHKKDKVLPEGHPDTKAVNWQSCKACHREGDIVLTGKVPGSHIHQLSGLTCTSCHGKAKKKEALKMEKCVSCHGDTDKLAEKTAKVKPENPHTSPHYGTSLDCNLCHHQHAKSENFCSQCHNFNFKAP